MKIHSFNDSLEFRNVSFEYNKNRKVLKNINVKINKGESIALVGESGAGKTTFVDLIPRYYDIKNGGIFIDNINVNDINVFSLRKQISIVSQDSILFNDTIYNNIKFGNNKANKEDIKNAIKISNSYKFIDELPKKLETIVGEKGTKLSGGQKQRIAIARAILKNSDILILDEATSSLDSTTEYGIKQELDKISKDKTLIIIAHRLSTILNADRILLFKDGEIIEEGNHDFLYKKNGEYAKLYDMQFSKNKK